jgi:hypothetical protein
MTAVVSAAGAQVASAAEGPTPQAVDAHAEFLAYAPPPPVPAKVCVVDTGVDLTTDAAPAVVERHSVFGGTTDDVGGSGLAKHGTLVAGAIASQLDGRDSVGIWPQARIVSVRVFAGSGGGTTVAALVAALERCRQLGTAVANISLSGLDRATGDELAWLENRLAMLKTAPAMNVVASAGNVGGAVGYPARFSSVLAVGASDRSGALCSFSNRGPELDALALGCGVELSWPGGGIGIGNGTSYSAPVVTAVLAALRAYRPDLSAPEAERLLVGHLSPDGRVNAAATFAVAGLAGLVVRSVDAPSAEGDHHASATTTMAPAPVGPLAELGVRPPRVRWARFRRHILSIAVSGVPDYGKAVFRVDGRTYSKAKGVLRMRMPRRPRNASVLIAIPGVGRTRSVVIRVRAGTIPASVGRGHSSAKRAMPKFN